MNKKIKKSLYLLLALVMTASSVLTAHATSNVGDSASEPATTYYFSQTFETGEEAIGTFTADAEVITAEDSTLESNALKITASAKKSSLYGSLSETITMQTADVVYIEMDVSAGNPVAAFGNMSFTFSDAANVDSATIWTTNDKGNKFKLASEDWLRFTVGKFLKVGLKLTFNTAADGEAANGKCELYQLDADGNWGAVQKTVSGLSITSLSKLRFKFNGTVENRTLFVDNVKVYTVEGVTPDGDGTGDDSGGSGDGTSEPPQPPADFDSTGKKLYFYKNFDGLQIGTSVQFNTSSYLNENYSRGGGEGLCLHLSQNPDKYKFYGYTMTMEEVIPAGKENVIIEMDLSTVRGQFDGYIALLEQKSIFQTSDWNAIINFYGGCIENTDRTLLEVVPGSFVKIGIKLNYKEGTWTLHAYDETDGWSDVLNSGTIADEKIETAISKMAIIGRSDSDAQIEPENADMLIDNLAVYTSEDFVENPAWLMWDLMGEPTVKEYITNLYETPTITPPIGEHPRVMFTADDIPTIKANLTHAENAIAYEKFLELKDKEYSGELPVSDKDNSDEEGLAIIEAKAFDYIINGNVENGRQAISAIINYLGSHDPKGASNDYHQAGYALFTAAEVYDWCYDLLDDATREKIVARCQYLATYHMSVGSPPIGAGSIAGHIAEYQLTRDWMALAIATYDEYPFIWDVTAGRYFQEYVPTRTWLYQSGAPYQGTGYGAFRFAGDLWAQLLICNMDKHDDVTSTLPENASMYPYHFIYARRPDYRLFIEGDTTDVSSKPIYWHNRSNRAFIVAAAFYKDSYIKGELLRSLKDGSGEFGYGYDNISAVHMLALNDTTVEVKPVSELPLVKYSGSPTGSMIARTGWKMGLDSEDALAYMNIGETYLANHDHRDAGSFQLYYKGNLAIDSGSYKKYGSEHNLSYNQSSVAHNTLAITSNANPSGVQRSIDEKIFNAGIEKVNENLSEVITGKTLGSEYKQTENKLDYAYIAGDIAAAYDSNVKDAVRSMLFMPLEDEDHPAAFVVFDRITSKEKDTKKIFQLHMLTEPEIDGNVVRIINTTDTYDPAQYGQYNGMLTNQTLLPADNVEISKLGGEGKQFWVSGKNLDDSHGTIEEGWGRVEISTTASEENQTDYMLNVMYVNDADKTLDLEEAVLIETDQVAGAQIFNRVAVFNKELIDQDTRCNDEMKFTIPAGDEAVYKVNVAGLKAGTWNIATSNGTITETATEEGGIVYFEAPAGEVTLVFVEQEEVVTPTPTPTPTAAPTSEPTSAPTATPTSEPTSVPTATPTSPEDNTSDDAGNDDAGDAEADSSQDTNADSTSATATPSTGDNSNAGLWIMLLVLSMGVCVIAFTLQKRKNI